MRTLNNDETINRLASNGEEGVMASVCHSYSSSPSIAPNRHKAALVSYQYLPVQHCYPH